MYTELKKARYFSIKVKMLSAETLTNGENIVKI